MRRAPKLEAAKAEVKRLWNLACEYDDISPNSTFVVFSQANPHSVAYNAAVSRYMRLRKARESRAARRDAIASLGMHEVRGALGGRYIE